MVVWCQILKSSLITSLHFTTGALFLVLAQGVERVVWCHPPSWRQLANGIYTIKTSSNNSHINKLWSKYQNTKSKIQISINLMAGFRRWFSRTSAKKSKLSEMMPSWQLPALHTTWMQHSGQHQGPKPNGMRLACWQSAKWTAIMITLVWMQVGIDVQHKNKWP